MDGVIEQRSLADAGFTRKDESATPALARAGQHSADRRQLALSPMQLSER